MVLRYRLHSPEDEPALSCLWSAHSRGDRGDPSTWAQQILHTPLGPSRIVVAEDDATGHIVGQLPFLPSRLAIHGCEVEALRPLAPTFTKSARASFHTPDPLHHPVVAMYRYGASVLRDQGHKLIYMVADPDWLPFYRLFPSLQCSTFPLWSRTLPVRERLALPSGYAAAPLEKWDGRVDRLWQATSRLYDCLAVRDTRVLPWKLSYEVTAVEHCGELVGLVASRQRGYRQWLVCDLLTADADDALGATLVAVVNLADDKARSADADKPIRKVSILVTPLMQAVAQTLNFVRDAYDFQLVVQPLSPGTFGSQVAPERWYLSAND
jgi:hypothetical protein